jgi:leader peptidase (prepilin peptidase)/N-methyltransferase
MILSQVMTSEPPTSYWVIALFMLALGGTIGSFLNVVAYRVPARMSLLYPPSRCPKCETPIRFFDNVPVLGWLKLRGRCRDCGQPISVRYPIVEAILALAFCWLALAGPLSGGANLPVPAMSSLALWGLYAYHLLLLCGLAAAALMEIDSHRPPKSLFVGLLAAAFLAGLIWPELHPLHAHPQLAELLERWSWTLGPIDFLFGAITGAVMASLAGPATGEGPTGLAGRTSTMFSLACVGAFLGWQAAVGIATITACLYALVVMYRHGWKPLHRVPFTACLAFVTLVWLCAWSTFTAQITRWGLKADAWSLGLAGAVILLISWIAWLFRVRKPVAA